MTAHSTLHRARGRPTGAVGAVAKAMLTAAASGPGTVVQLAERACVGYGAARYTASRLVSSGALSPLSPGRPAILAVAGPGGPAPGVAACGLEALRLFWEQAPRYGDAEDDAMT